MLELDRIYCGDCVEMVGQIEDASVHLTVTSPPYEDARDYHKKGKWDWDTFTRLAQQLYRVAVEGGVVVWVVSDVTREFCESLLSFKQAIYFVEEAKFNLLDTMIWWNRSRPPSYPGMRRYTQAFQYMFVLSKGKPRTANLQRKPTADRRLNRAVGYRQRDGSIQRQYIRETRPDKPFSNVWDIPYISSNDARAKIAHPATFSDEMVLRHILTWTEEGDTVLDPFVGSGTTAYVAHKANRHYIGIDVTEAYRRMAQARIDNEGMHII